MFTMLPFCKHAPFVDILQLYLLIQGFPSYSVGRRGAHLQESNIACLPDNVFILGKILSRMRRNERKVHQTRNDR